VRSCAAPAGQLGLVGGRRQRVDGGQVVQRLDGVPGPNAADADRVADRLEDRPRIAWSRQVRFLLRAGVARRRSAASSREM
jgi:hypothetical protein